MLKTKYVDPVLKQLNIPALVFVSPQCSFHTLVKCPGFDYF